MRFIENMGMKKANDDFGTLLASSEQLLCVSLKDDVIQIRCAFYFSISSGQMSQFQIKIDSDVKVINVKTNLEPPIKK